MDHESNVMWLISTLPTHTPKKCISKLLYNMYMYIHVVKSKICMMNDDDDINIFLSLQKEILG